MLKRLLGRKRVFPARRHVHANKPALEMLETRLVPTATLSAPQTDIANGKVFANLAGTSGADHVVIHDFGNGTIRVNDADTGQVIGTRTGLDQLNVATFGGDDTVHYVLEGNVSRDMKLSVLLGNGSDRFTGTLNHDINAGRTLKVDVDGGAGNDLLTLYGTPTAPVRANDHLTDGLVINNGGLAIGTGGVLDVRMHGGGDNDRIFFDYQGKLDGTLKLDLEGDGGNDTVSAIVNIDANSTGQVGSAASKPLVSGGDGSDTLTFQIFDHSGNHIPVNHATIDGGENILNFLFDTDTGTRTSNVTPVGF
jgi:hypothetical protein